MAEPYVHEIEVNDGTRRRSLGWLWVFLFLLGLLLGLLLSYLLTMDHTNSATDANGVSTKSGNALFTASDASTPVVRLTDYSTMLIEASREGTDVPGEEASAAKAALDTTTTNLVSTFGNSDTLRTDLNTLNTSVLNYASTAETTTDHTAVDQGFAKLMSDLESQYSVSDKDMMSAKINELRDTVIASINAFVTKDYAGSYAKQASAETTIVQTFHLLTVK